MGTEAPSRRVPDHLIDRSRRERELQRACEALTTGSRLVTFCGPAGVGKTWAAREVERRLLTSGGWRGAWVRVEPARGFSELMQRTAGALAMPAAGGGLRDRLTKVLAAERHLLVLDGCERLVGHPHPVAQLLELEPGLVVVATSLGPLRAEHEMVIGLDPLEVPPPGAPPEVVAESPAVVLFLQRAQNGGRRPATSAAELAAVGELCRRVHGLPLGIEIMASRAASESPQATVDYLDQGHEVTLRLSRSSDEQRHLSLQAALRWSCGMLSPPAERLLRRMSVFAGPATLDMLTTVVPEGDPHQPGADSDVHDTVSDLVDHRLVDPASGWGEPAFVLVRLLRSIAAERLVEAGEQACTEEARIRAVIDFAVARSEAVEIIEDVVAQGAMARAEADLRQVLRRLVGAADVQRGLVLAIALAPFVLRRGYDGFVLAALGSVLRMARTRNPVDDRVPRAELWNARLLAKFDGPTARDDIRACLRDGLDRARRAGDTDTLLLGLAFVLQTLPATGDLDAAAEAVEEGLPLARAAGDVRWEGRFLAWSAIVANQQRRVDDALEFLARGLHHIQGSHDSRTEILLLLGATGLPPDLSPALLRQLPTAEDLIDKARRLDDARYEPFLLRAATTLALRRGDLRTAAARCGEFVRLAHRQATWHDLPHAVLLLALVAARRGDLTVAARLHGMVASRLEVMRPAVSPVWMEEYEKEINTVCRRLGSAVFETLTNQGADDMRANALTEVLGYADAAAAVRGRGPMPEQRVSVTEDADRLTPREVEVLVELTTGATNKEISRRLGMSPKTVMHHSTAIYRKLRVRGRAEATAWAFRHGIAA